MATIGSVDQLVAAIQAQLAARTRSTATPAAAISSAPAKRKTHPGRYAQQNLGALIELRIARIERDDPQRGRKAFRVFLEAVLLSHLGEGLVADPRFFQLVDDVQAALEGDAECAAMVTSAIDQLLAPRPD
jgi:hypothetical protein